MSGPVNTTESTSHSWVEQYYNPVGTPSYSVPLSAIQTSHALQHPALVRNPIREDGTRTVSAWNRSWFNAISPIGTWSVARKTGDIPFLVGRGALTLRELPQKGGTFWSSVGSFFPWSPTLEIHSDAVARTKTLNKIAQVKWDLGVTAVELKQTAELVTSAAVSIARGVEGLINFRRKSADKTDRLLRALVRNKDDWSLAAREIGMRDIRLLEDLRGKWMSYQFGIRPLLYDVDDAVNYFASHLSEGFPILVKAKAGHTDTSRYLSPVLGRSPGIWEVRAQMVETCTTHYSICYEMPTGHVSNITSLGLDNPWKIGWEVTRLSWMFDYVVGVGNWVSSFTAANGMIFREGTRSMLKRLVSEALHAKDLLGSDPTLYVKTMPPLRGGYVQRGQFTRIVLESGISPAVVPQIKSRLGLVQMANSLFALSSVLGGRPGLR